MNDKVVISLSQASDEQVTPPLWEILDQVEAFVRRYIVLASDQAAAIALWIVHTWVHDAFECTPYIAFTSAAKQSGKTRALEVVGMLVRNATFTASLTPAVLFRTIDKSPTTLLMDELDTVFGRREGNEELRGLLNAGYQRGGQVQRCETVGKAIKVNTFEVFCPKAFAAIGTLPDTVADRSIHIRMHRKTSAEMVDRFRRRLVRPDAQRLVDWLSGWATTAVEELRDAWPPLPDDLDDRGQDAWEPLLAIADLAGHGWDGRARLAAMSLANARDDGTENTGTLLLGHCREIIGSRAWIGTVDLLGGLVDREDGPWASWWAVDVDTNRTKGPASRLARMLKPFGVEPRKIRDGETTIRGYTAEGFAEAWSRYLPPLPPNNTEHGTRDGNEDVDQRVPSFQASRKGEGVPTSNA